MRPSTTWKKSISSSAGSNLYRAVEHCLIEWWLGRHLRTILGRKNNKLTENPPANAAHALSYCSATRRLGNLVQCRRSDLPSASFRVSLAQYTATLMAFNQTHVVTKWLARQTDLPSAQSASALSRRRRPTVDARKPTLPKLAFVLALEQFEQQSYLC